MGSIDLKRIHELLEDGGADLIPELIAIFLSETPPKIARLEQAAAAGDARAAREAAHSLRSSALNIGAERLATLAGELERLGESGKLGRCEPLLESIRREVRSVEDELKRLPEAEAA